MIYASMSLLGICAVALAVPAAASAQPPMGLRIEHAAARVVVIPEPRGDVVVSVQQGGAGLPALQVRRDGGVVVVEGGLGGRSGGFWHWGWSGLNCRGSGARAAVGIPGHGWVPVANLPVITARVPLDARVGAGEAVWGEIGPARSLDLANAGCGDWTVADVRGGLSVSVAGSGDVRAGSAGATRVAVSGSGDVYMVAANGGLDAHVSGSGDVHARAVNGPVGAKIAGSGDVTIDGGQAPNVGVSIAGSGDFRFRGVAGALSAAVVGSGDVDVARVTGPISKHVVGSGDVNVGR
jgi:hypothetical protein